MTAPGIRGRLAVAVLVGSIAALVVAPKAAWGHHSGWIKVKSPSTGTFSYGSPVTGQTSTGHGAVGSTVKVTAGTLKPKPAKYTLLYAPPGSGLCTDATQILKSPAGVELTAMKTNSNGELDSNPTLTGLQAYKAVIPADSPTGTALICARESYPTPGDTFTLDLEFVVTAG